MHPSQDFSFEAGYALHPAKVKVEMPGLLPEQDARYEHYVLNILTQLAGFLDLTTLAVVKFHPRMLDGLRSFNKDICEVPNSAVCAAISVRQLSGSNEIVIVADLHHALGLFDPDHPNYLDCLQSFGHALGHAHAASQFEKSFPKGVRTSLDPNWAKVTTNCYREYVASFHTHAIGTDPLNSRCRRLEENFNAAMAGGADIAEMVDSEGYCFDQKSWSVFECYRGFFLAASSLIGSLSAKGLTVDDLASSRLKVPEGLLFWLDLYRLRMLVIRQTIALGSNVGAAFYDFGEDLKSTLYHFEAERNPEVAQHAMVMHTDYSAHSSSVYGFSFLPKG